MSILSKDLRAVFFTSVNDRCNNIMEEMKIGRCFVCKGAQMKEGNVNGF